MARRERDYAAERAAAWARAEALGLSRSAALGKPRKGEQTKRAAGVDARTKVGRVAAEARAVARGAELPKPGAVQKASTAAGEVRSSTNPRRIGGLLANLRDSRKVDVVIETVDPVTGARRQLQPWKRGGINAGTLKSMMEDAEGSWADCVTDAGTSGQAGSTDLDALAVGDSAIVNVTLTYR